MDHGLARTRDTAGAVEIGVGGKGLGGVPDRGVEALGGGRIARGDIVDDVEEIVLRFVRPDERERQRRLCLSIAACAAAMT